MTFPTIGELLKLRHCHHDVPRPTWHTLSQPARMVVLPRLRVLAQVVLLVTLLKEFNSLMEYGNCL